MFNTITNSSKRNTQYFFIICIVSIILLIILDAKKPKFESIDSEKAKEIITTEESYIILDIREKDEYNKLHIPNSINIPYDEITKEKLYNSAKFSCHVIICGSNNDNTKELAQKLINLGYTNVYDLGCIENWNYKTN